MQGLTGAIFPLSNRNRSQVTVKISQNQSDIETGIQTRSCVQKTASLLSASKVAIVILVHLAQCHVRQERTQPTIISRCLPVGHRTCLPVDVLVVDDDAPLSRALRSSLSEHGYLIA